MLTCELDAVAAVCRHVSGAVRLVHLDSRLLQSCPLPSND